MNSRERRMTDILLHAKDQFGALALKAEFEAEGARLAEVWQLSNIANKVGLDLAIKIGGCEAIRDIMEAKQMGAKYIISPMIESPYALSKYISSKKKVFHNQDNSPVEFLFNIETKTGVDNIDQIIELAVSSKECTGIVFGRHDYSESIGLGFQSVEDDEVCILSEKIATLCSVNGLDFTLGGSISLASINNLKRIKLIYLNRFETRKIIFNADTIDTNFLEDSISLALEFELLWLFNKSEYYNYISLEDQDRISMLSKMTK